MKLIVSLVLSAVMIGTTGIQGSGDGLAVDVGHNPFASPLAGGPQVNARSLADSRLAPVHPPASPASAPPASPPRRIASAKSVLRGIASWGPFSGHVVTRFPRGTRISVTGPLGTWRGTSWGYGPQARTGRIADLDRSVFARICGSPTKGLCRVVLTVYRSA